jgi:hypothetical protein
MDNVINFPSSEADAFSMPALLSHEDALSRYHAALAAAAQIDPGEAERRAINTSIQQRLASIREGLPAAAALQQRADELQARAVTSQQASPGTEALLTATSAVLPLVANLAQQAAHAGIERFREETASTKAWNQQGRSALGLLPGLLGVFIR